MSAASWYQKPAAHRPAVDGGDDRLAEPPHVLPFDDALAVAALPIFDEFGDRLAGRIGIARVPDLFVALVEAGAEGGAGAGQDDDPDRAVGVRLVEGAVQLVLEIAATARSSGRTIERDGRDACPRRCRSGPRSSFVFLSFRGLGAH